MKQTLIQQMADFVQGLGIPVRMESIPHDTFLPGLKIADGALVVDAERLDWPGDILHEAAHIALATPSRRPLLDGKLTISPAEEMAALAWSYAAAVRLEMDPQIIFHEGGYKKGSAQLIAQYSSGLPPGGPGVPILQWFGMTTQFPRMNSWLRSTEDPE